MLDPTTFLEPEWLDWYRKTPQERLLATSGAWDNYLALGGSLDPDVDSQCPFWSRDDLVAFAQSHASLATKSS